MGTTEIDVMVVGAGPTGLALAHELRRHGLRCRVIDQGEGPSIWSKAQAIHARTLVRGSVPPTRGTRRFTGGRR